MSSPANTYPVRNLHWKLVRLMMDGQRFTAEWISGQVGDTVQRTKAALTKMHRAGVVYVSSWEPGGVPLYALAPPGERVPDAVNPWAKQKRVPKAAEPKNPQPKNPQPVPTPKFGFWGM